jgi:hypothetical protein
MKTRVFVIAILLALSCSLSAQPIGKINLDSIKFGDNFKQKLLPDRLKLGDQFSENNLQLQANSYQFKKQEKNLELVSGQRYNMDNMPIVRLNNFKSNMPVMKPDSTTNYFIKIAGPLPQKH